MEIDWKKTAFVFSAIFLTYAFFAHKFFFRALGRELFSFWHFLIMPIIGVGRIFTSPHSDVFSMCLVVVLFVTFIGLAKLIIRR